MTGRHIAQRSGQRAEIGLNLAGDLRRRTGANPGGGQFNAQRHALQQPADGQNACLILRQIERSLSLPGTLPEERYRLKARQISHICFGWIR